MSVEVKKHENSRPKVAVEVNVANIVKYVCITSVIIVSIVFGCKTFSKMIDSNMFDFMKRSNKN